MLKKGTHSKNGGKKKEKLKPCNLAYFKQLQILLLIVVFYKKDILFKIRSLVITIKEKLKLKDGLISI